MKRWLVRGGIALGVLVLLIVAFYVEENWRGARLWVATKAEYEAKGFSFDPLTLLPRPIPDDQNFAASEIWKRFIGARDGKGFERYKIALFEANKSVKKWKTENKIHPSWNLGEKSTPPPAALFDQAQNDLNEVYAAFSIRPDCQFIVPYSKDFPTSTPLPHLGPCLGLGQALEAHATIQFAQRKADLAENDLSLSIKLAKANVDTPYIISGLVGLSLYQLSARILWQGIEEHTWSESQLSSIQNKFSDVNLLQSGIDCFRGELVLMQLPTVTWVQQHPKFPGSYDLIKFKLFDFYVNGLSPVVDGKARLFHPEKLPDTDCYLKAVKFRAYLNPANLLIALLLPASDGVLTKYAMTQTFLDLAQVACGLERYWLVNKKYPATLAELEPKFIAHVPHDLCNGEPLHYRVGADGDYTLYSVGFNGTDDGRKIVMKKDSATAIDPKQGDWVWPRSAHPQGN